MGYDDDNQIPQPVLDYEPVRNAEKKSNKQQEKERKKSQSRTREKPNPLQAHIFLLDETDVYIDFGVREFIVWSLTESISFFVL